MSNNDLSAASVAAASSVQPPRILFEGKFTYCVKCWNPNKQSMRGLLENSVSLGIRVGVSLSNDGRAHTYFVWIKGNGNFAPWVEPRESGQRWYLPSFSRSLRRYLAQCYGNWGAEEFMHPDLLFAYPAHKRDAILFGFNGAPHVAATALGSGAMFDRLIGFLNDPKSVLGLRGRGGDLLRSTQLLGDTMEERRVWSSLLRTEDLGELPPVPRAAHAFEDWKKPVQWL